MRLDDQNGIVYNILFLVPVREFFEQSTHILVSRLSVSMLNVKKDDRMHMVSWALELLVHHRAQIMAGASLGDATPCVLCDLSMQALGCVSLDADRFVAGAHCGGMPLVAHSCRPPLVSKTLAPAAWAPSCAQFAKQATRCASADEDGRCEGGAPLERKHFAPSRAVCGGGGG